MLKAKSRYQYLNFSQQWRMLALISVIIGFITIKAAFAYSIELDCIMGPNGQDVCLGDLYDVTREDVGEVGDIVSAWTDFDNDDDPDAFIVHSDGTVGLYVYDLGLDTYTEEATDRGIGSSAGVTHGAWGDYDNDGDFDLAVTGLASLGGQSYLYENSGAPNYTFTDVSAGYGLDFTNAKTVSWADLDTDNDLDVIYGFNGAPYFSVYENINAGVSFSEEYAGSGMVVSFSATGLAIFDYDDDCDQDIIVTYRLNGAPNISSLLVLENQTQQGFPFTFNSVTSTVFDEGVPTDSGNDLNVVIGDYDDDGDQDVYVVRAGQPSILYEYNGTDYDDVTATYLVDGPGTGGSSAAWGDYDNDGDLDLFVSFPQEDSTSWIYVNNGPGVYFSIDYAGMENELQSINRSGTFIDYNADGDLDLFMMREGETNVLWISDINDTNFIRVNLRGQGGAANQHGAKVTLYRPAPNDAEIEGSRIIYTNSDAASTSDYVMHFGAPDDGTYSAEIRYSDCSVVQIGGNPGDTITGEISTPVASVTVAPASSQIYVGETVQLSATVLPAEADQSVTWSSLDVGVATVDATGLVTAVSVGTAVIRAESSSDPTKFDESSVKVNEILDVIVYPQSAGIGYENPIQLVPVVICATVPCDQDVIWSPGLVDAFGVYTPGPGSGTSPAVEITAQSTHSADTGISLISATDDVTPLLYLGATPPTRVEVLPFTFSLALGESRQLNAVLYCGADPCSYQGFTWSTGGSPIASVDANGLVTANSLGTVLVTATATDTDLYSTTELTVVAAGATNSVAIDPRRGDLSPTETLGFDATSDPSGVGQTVSWSVSNPEVATVTSNGGVVEALTERATMLYATSEQYNLIYDGVPVIVTQPGSPPTGGSEVTANTTLSPALNGERVNTSGTYQFTSEHTDSHGCDQITQVTSLFDSAAVSPAGAAGRLLTYYDAFYGVFYVYDESGNAFVSAGPDATTDVDGGYATLKSATTASCTDDTLTINWFVEFNAADAPWNESDVNLYFRTEGTDPDADTGLEAMGSIDVDTSAPIVNSFAVTGAEHSSGSNYYIDAAGSMVIRVDASDVGPAVDISKTHLILTHDTGTVTEGVWDWDANTLTILTDDNPHIDIDSAAEISEVGADHVIDFTVIGPDAVGGGGMKDRWYEMFAHTAYAQAVGNGGNFNIDAENFDLPPTMTPVGGGGEGNAGTESATENAVVDMTPPEVTSLIGNPDTDWTTTRNFTFTGGAEDTLPESGMDYVSIQMSGDQNLLAERATTTYTPVNQFESTFGDSLLNLQQEHPIIRFTAYDNVGNSAYEDFVPHIDLNDPLIIGTIPAAEGYLYNMSQDIIIEVEEDHQSVYDDNHELLNATDSTITIDRIDALGAILESIPLESVSVEISEKEVSRQVLHIRVNPEDPLELFQRYRVSVLAGITDGAGNALGPVPYQATFEAVGHPLPLRVEKTSAGTTTPNWLRMGDLVSRDYTGNFTSWSSTGINAVPQQQVTYQRLGVGPTDFGAVFKTSTGTLLAGTRTVDDNPALNSIYRSTDNGSTWIKIRNLPNTYSVNQFAEITNDADGTDGVYFVTNGGGTITSGPAVWRSTDDGVTWTQRFYFSPGYGVISGISSITAEQAGDGTSLMIGVVHTSGGSVWRSTDAGATWNNMGGNELPPTTMLTSCVLTVYSDSANRLFAGTGDEGCSANSSTRGTVYKYSAAITDDNGTWVAQGKPHANTTNVFELTEGDGAASALYAATSDGTTGSVYRSQNLGVTWTTTTVSGTEFRALWYEESTDTMFAGGMTSVSGGVVYSSNDRGSTWRITGYITGNITHVYDLALNANRYGMVATGFDDEFFQYFGDIMRSSGPLYSSPYAHEGSAGDVPVNYTPTAVYETSDGTLYATSISDGYCLYRSTNGGTSWLPVFIDNCAGLNTIIEDHDGNLLAGGQSITYPGGDLNRGVIFRSTDEGTTWTEVMSDIGYYYSIYTIKQSPTSNIFYASGSGECNYLIASANGTTWYGILGEETSSECAVIYDLELTPSESPPVFQPDPNLIDTIYAVGIEDHGDGLHEAQLWKSNDGATTWDSNSFPYVLGADDRGTDIMIARDGYMYIAGYEINVDLSYTPRVYRSPDLGQTWFTTGQLGSGRGAVQSMTEGKNNLIYASGFKGGSAYGANPGPGVVFQSNDRGATWTEVGSISASSSASGITYSNSMNRLLVSVRLASSRILEVYKSNASSTTASNPGKVLSLLNDVINDRFVLSTSNGSVFSSSNDALTWTEMGNLSKATQVSQVTVDDDSTLYAAGTVSSNSYVEITGPGSVCDGARPVFRSYNNGSSWTAAPGRLVLDRASPLAVLCINSVASVVQSSSGRIITSGGGLMPDSCPFCTDEEYVGAVFYSDSDGGTWTTVDIGTMPFQRIYQASDNDLYGVVQQAEASCASGCSGSIQRSADDGETWSATAALHPTDLIYAYDIVEAIDGSLYVPGYNVDAALGTVFRSTDDGASWSITGTVDAPGSIFRIGQNADGTFYGAGGDINGTFGAVYSSPDGITWTQVGNNIPTTDYTYAIMLPDDDIYVGSGNSDGSVYKYEDRVILADDTQEIFQDDGDLLTDIDRLTYNLKLYADGAYLVNSRIRAPHTMRDMLPPHFSIEPGSVTYSIYDHDGSTRATGTLDDTDVDEVLIENEAAEGKEVTFTVPSSGPVTPAWTTHTDLTDSTDIAGVYETSRGSILVAGGNSATIYRSTDGGTSWTSTYTFPADIDHASFIEDSSGTIYIATADSTHFATSSNDGVTWILKTKPANNHDPQSIILYDGAIYSFGRAVYKSIDQGTSWIQLSNPSTSLTNAILSIDGYFYATDNATIERSIDAVSWTTIGTVTGASTPGWLMESVTGRMYVVDTEVDAGLVYRSDDRGENWVATSAFPLTDPGSTIDYAYQITEVTGENGAIYVGAHEENIPLHGPNGIGRVFRTTDYGNTWTAVGTFSAADSGDPKRMTQLNTGALLAGFSPRTNGINTNIRTLLDNVTTSPEDILRGGWLEIEYIVNVLLP